MLDADLICLHTVADQTRDGAVIKAGDASAAAITDIYKPQGRQRTKRLPHDSARDAQTLRKGQLARQGIARMQAMVANVVADRLDNIVSQVRRAGCIGRLAWYIVDIRHVTQNLYDRYGNNCVYLGETLVSKKRLSGARREGP